MSLADDLANAALERMQRANPELAEIVRAQRQVYTLGLLEGYMAGIQWMRAALAEKKPPEGEGFGGLASPAAWE